MIELGVIFGLYVIGSLIVIRLQGKEAREERAELELALMAVTKPEAAITHRASLDPQPAKVSYEGEEPPVRISGNGTVFYEGEEE